MRTTVIVDEKLIQAAMRATGLANKREVIEEGLRMLIKIKRQVGVRRLRGKIKDGANQNTFWRHTAQSPVRRLLQAVVEKYARADICQAAETMIL